jgi:hypothetical protein
MTLSKKALMDALKRVMPGVDAEGSILQGADTFVFSGGQIHSFNDAVSVSVDFPTEDPIDGAVKAKEFYALLSRLSVDDIKIVAEDQRWRLRSGSAKVELSLLDAGILDHIKGIRKDLKWKALPKTFAEGLGLCKIGCNKSPFSGIMISGKRMVSTDERRINRFALDSEMDQLWIADPAAFELMKIQDLAEYGLTDSWAHFRTAAGVVFSAKRLLDQKFPLVKLEAILDACAKAKGDIEGVFPEKTIDVIDRASTFFIESGDYRAVRLEFSGKGVEISAERAAGSYTEMVEWEKPMTIGDFTIYLDSEFAVYGLRRSREFYIHAEDVKGKPKYRVVLSRPNVVHLLSSIEIGK